MNGTSKYGIVDETKVLKEDCNFEMDGTLKEEHITRMNDELCLGTT